MAERWLKARRPHTMQSRLQIPHCPAAEYPLQSSHGRQGTVRSGETDGTFHPMVERICDIAVAPDRLEHLLDARGQRLDQAPGAARGGISDLMIERGGRAHRPWP